MAKVKLNGVRLSHSNLWVAEYFDPTKPAGSKRYSAGLMISKEDTASIAAVNAAIASEIKAAFGDKAGAMLKAFRADPQKYCFQDGDEKLTGSGDPIAPGYWVLSSHRRESDGMPTVIDTKKQALGPNSGKPYDGCYVNASVDVWVQTKSYPGVRCSLLGVQFAKDGDAFGGARPASLDEFESLDDDENDGNVPSVDDLDLGV